MPNISWWMICYLTFNLFVSISFKPIELNLPWARPARKLDCLAVPLYLPSVVQHRVSVEIDGELFASC